MVFKSEKIACFGLRISVLQNFKLLRFISLLASQTSPNRSMCYDNAGISEYSFYKKRRVTKHKEESLFYFNKNFLKELSQSGFLVKFSASS